jgi:hypothetical protein
MFSLCLLIPGYDVFSIEVFHLRACEVLDMMLSFFAILQVVANQLPSAVLKEHLAEFMKRLD